MPSATPHLPSVVVTAQPRARSRTVRSSCVAALVALVAVLSGCGGGSANDAVAPAAESVAVDGAAGPVSRISLATPEAVDGSNRIALRWSAHGKALRYSVLLRRSDREDYTVVADGLSGGSTIIARDAAWQFDFPTARVKVRGCNPGNRCTDSNEQPLLGALMDGIVALRSEQPDRTFNVNNPDGTINVRFDFFSLAVALNANGSRLAATAQERIYVFDRASDGTWARMHLAGPRGSGGVLLSADGNTMVVGAPGEPGTYGGINPPPGPDDGDVFTSPLWGAMYVFVRNAQGQWQRQAHIRQDARRPFESFAVDFGLSADGNTLAVSTAGGGGGRAYLFVREGASWRQDSIVSTPPSDNFEQLVGSLALSRDGRVMALGGSGEQDTSGFTVYRFVDVYTRPAGGAWARQARLNSKKRVFLDIDDFFGSDLALDQDGATVAVGAPDDDSDASDSVGDPANRNALASGAVYVFKRNGTTWQQQAFIKAREAAAGDHFGNRIQLDQQGTLLMGSALGLAANVPDVNRNNEADRPRPSDTFSGGAAYFFDLRDGAWRERATVLPPTVGSITAAFFTTALSADGSTYALGADALQRVGDIVTQRARVYVY